MAHHSSRLSEAASVPAVKQNRIGNAVRGNVKRDQEHAALGPFLSTGSTLLNLALSDRWYGGLLAGNYYLFVGDSTSGKTLMSLSCLAEACVDSAFSEHRLIYDGAEHGCLFDLEKMFSKSIADRIEAPEYDNGVPVYSQVLEEFYFKLADLCDEAESGGGRPFVYVLDSMDVLKCAAENKRFDKAKKAFESKGESEESGYMVQKARVNSEGLRRMMGPLAATNSILIILSQTRANLGFGFSTKTRSGGHALEFYATCEIWSSVIKSLKKTVNGRPRRIGVTSRFRLSKNRITGKLHDVAVDLLPSFGVDDLGSCIDFLVEEKHWKKARGGVSAVEMNVVMQREALIREIERRGVEDRMRRLVGKKWREIQRASSVDRKRRYAD